MLRTSAPAASTAGLLAASLLIALPGCGTESEIGDYVAEGSGETTGSEEVTGTSEEVTGTRDDGSGGALASWRMAGQNLHNTRHQPAETVIGPDNASRLTIKWQIDLEGSVYVTPAVVDGAVYVSDSAGYFYKVAAEDGEILWRREVEDWVDRRQEMARTTAFVADDRLIVGTQNNRLLQKLLDRNQGAFLVAVGPTDGELLWRRKVDDSRAAKVSQSAVVHDGKVYVGVASGEETLAVSPGFDCCEFRGSALVLDAGTGEVEHRRYMTPEGYSGAALWGSTQVIDRERGAVYLTTGNNYSVPEEVERCIRDCASSRCDTEGIRRCLTRDGGNHFDAIVALDLESHEVRWVYEAIPYDAWNLACEVDAFNTNNCPEPSGPDYDFGQGPALITLDDGRQLVGAGQKNGWYWALDPDTGELVWATEVGPGGLLGGSEWGSATDGERVYVAIANSQKTQWQLQGSGPFAGFYVRRGLWSALDAATGEILWQTPEPDEPLIPYKGPQGPVTVAGGVLFGGTRTRGEHDMFALDAETGEILWRFDSGGNVDSGAAVAGGVVYWGATCPTPDDSKTYGAARTFLPEGEGSLYAFCVAGTEECPGSIPSLPPSQQENSRSRNHGYPQPPPQIPASGTTALGSCLG